MIERIVVDPSIQHGKPIVRGTRVPVVRILGGLAGGMTIDEVVREYEVTHDDVRAVLAYASRLVDEEAHHPLP